MLIGMPEAARRAGASRSSIKRTLENGGVPIVQINGKAHAVEEGDLAVFLASRPEGYRKGRPAGSKNKPAADAGNDMPR